MSLISAGSISLDSTFKPLTKLRFCALSDEAFQNLTAASIDSLTALTVIPTASVGKTWPLLRSSHFLGLCFTLTSSIGILGAYSSPLTAFATVPRPLIAISWSLQALSRILYVLYNTPSRCLWCCHLLGLDCDTLSHQLPGPIQVLLNNIHGLYSHSLSLYKHYHGTASTSTLTSFWKTAHNYCKSYFMASYGRLMASFSILTASATLSSPPLAFQGPQQDSDLEAQCSFLKYILSI
jgi:hypothetical protein